MFLSSPNAALVASQLCIHHDVYSVTLCAQQNLHMEVFEGNLELECLVYAINLPSQIYHVGMGDDAD